MIAENTEQIQLSLEGLFFGSCCSEERILLCCRCIFTDVQQTYFELSGPNKCPSKRTRSNPLRGIAFAGKVTLIHSNLDTVVLTGPVGVTLVPACSVTMDMFQLMQFGDVDMILGDSKTTTCVLDQWSPTLGLQMFLDYTSQKLSQPPLLTRISGS